MTPTPEQIAAMAAALHRTGTPPCMPSPSAGGTNEPTRTLWECSAKAHRPDAAAILAALDGWTLVPTAIPTGASPTAYTVRVMEAEIERLRAALNLTAIPALLVFAEGNAGAREAIHRLRAVVGPQSGKGRVTNRKLDQRLKGNRDRRAALAEDAT